MASRSPVRRALLASLQEGPVADQGTVDLSIARLPLLPGTYDVIAAITEAGSNMGVPDRAHSLRISVERGGGDEEHGVVSLGGHWESAHRGVAT